MDLIKFKDQLQGSGKNGPPVSIRAADLDSNFKICLLAPDKKGIYKVTKSENGQELEFMARNLPVDWREIDVCVNGVAKKMLVLASEPY